MATISMAVAVADEVEAGRKKQGDIIAIKPGGWQWGTGEVSDLLILEVSLPVGFPKNKLYALMSPYLAGGVFSWQDTIPEVLAKRRFRIDWTSLKTIIAEASIPVDWNKVEDKTIAYQPLSTQTVAPGGNNFNLNPMNLVFDKYHNRLIRAQDFGEWIIG